MADIVNLNKARKNRALSEKKQEAAANRALHGRTKAERTAGRRAQEKAAKTHDGNKREEG
jgi:hypothetical protein